MKLLLSLYKLKEKLKKKRENLTYHTTKNKMRSLSNKSIFLLIFLILYSFELSKCDESNENAVILVDAQDSEEVDKPAVNRINEKITISDKVFIPTNEWQVVKEGQAIPPGIHVRLNIRTGEREAKLMDNQGSDQTKGSKIIENDHKHTLSKEFEEAIKKLNDDFKGEKSPQNVIIYSP